MKVLILCGGRGRRLGPLTEDLPKPLIPVGNESILELKIKDLLARGLDELIFCIGYKGGLVRKAVEKYGAFASVEFSDAGEHAGMLARIWHARDLFADTVLLTYGDTFTDIDLDELVAAHRRGAHAATIVAAPIENPFGLVEFDHENRVTYFKEKPTLTYYIGQAVIEKSALSLVPPGIIDLPDGEGLVTFFRVLVAMGKLGVYCHAGLEITFNTPEELDLAKQKLGRFYTHREQQHER